MTAKGSLYPECKHVKRPKPDSRVTEEISKEIGSKYRTLPAFEQGLFEYVYTKHYSLQRNELLKCTWEEYKKHIEFRVFAPFQFPNIRDLHFHNGSVQFRPSESIYKYPEYKKKLRPGPGVDNRGQLPIPQELLKRGTEQDGGRKVIKKKR
ncbi:uncharacterized protein [Epargyreus clarus]|uniref:uncharacterized protein n=1 Tax=Epargyreus clarus TaxID=520877 RepID=UPI003C2B48D6